MATWSKTDRFASRAAKSDAPGPGTYVASGHGVCAGCAHRSCAPRVLQVLTWTPPLSHSVPVHLLYAPGSYDAPPLTGSNAREVVRAARAEVRERRGRSGTSRGVGGHVWVRCAAYVAACVCRVQCCAVQVRAYATHTHAPVVSARHENDTLPAHVFDSASLALLRASVLTCHLCYCQCHLAATARASAGPRLHRRAGRTPSL